MEYCQGPDFGAQGRGNQEPQRQPAPGPSLHISQLYRAIMEFPMSSGSKDKWLAAARAAIEIEAASLATAACRLNGELIRAVDLILAHPGKVVVTGIGKSGHIARKVVAPLCSPGTAAVFLHPAEAGHR